MYLGNFKVVPRMPWGIVSDKQDMEYVQAVESTNQVSFLQYIPPPHLGLQGRGWWREEVVRPPPEATAPHSEWSGDLRSKNAAQGYETTRKLVSDT